MPSWVGPTAAIALVVIALSLLVMGTVAVVIGLGLRKAKRDVTRQLAAFTADAKAAASRLRAEIEGFAEISGETRAKLKRGVAKVEDRLLDLDALVEVLQEEAEDTALDVAAMVRTARHPLSVFGVARAALRARRRRS